MSTDTNAEAQPDEDSERAHLYGLLSALLATPPAADRLGLLAQLSGDETPLGQAFGDLAAKAKALAPAAVEQEFNDLFIGVTHGELMPFASSYLTGFLNGKPLLAVREALDVIGVERAENVKEPEDHMAFLCEVMNGLILGTYGPDYCLNKQKEFFHDHIQPWGEKFFKDLETAPSAALYGPVGTIGRLFMEIEAEAFELGE